MAFEFMHYLNHKDDGKDNYMSIKLYMSKAFDRVDWKFIHEVMVKMGFAKKWVDLIMHCISSVSYSVIINGEPCGNITPSRGLRQGDPLSLYLFLLCSEGLLAPIHKAARDKLISGISIGRGCPILTHLFFADDSLLFCKAKEQECQKLVDILNKYEAASGQKINNRQVFSLFQPKHLS